MLSNFKTHKGVYYITQKKDTFSSIYIDVRKKEERIYSDAIVKRLPYVTKTHRYYQEWKLRQKSAERLIKYLNATKTRLKILDIGCGNGWFSHQLSTIPHSEVFALDINDVELEQATRVFSKPNLKFVYANIFASETLTVLKDFDIITVNSCIQYFPNLSKTIDVLEQMLNKNGELHIFDSPFYSYEEILRAKKRTHKYYASIGFPEMSNHYFHHTLKDIEDYRIMHKPDITFYDKLFRKKTNPFYWIKILKQSAGEKKDS